MAVKYSAETSHIEMCIASCIHNYLEQTTMFNCLYYMCMAYTLNFNAGVQRNINFNVLKLSHAYHTLALFKKPYNYVLYINNYS